MLSRYHPVPRRRDDKNQKSFSKVVIMKYKKIRLVVGFQKTKGEYVQYSITVQQKKKKNKSRLGCDF